MEDDLKECVWNQDGEGEDAWGTGCRRIFRLDEGTPSENEMRFCCFCGKPLREAPWVETDN